MGLYGLAYFSLSSGISTFETVWGNIWLVHKLFWAYFHQLSKIAYTKMIWLYFIFCYRNSFYISAYFHKHLCYKLQMKFLIEIGLRFFWVMSYEFNLSTLFFMTVLNLKMRLNKSWSTLELVFYQWLMLALILMVVSSLLLSHRAPLLMVIYALLPTTLLWNLFILVGCCWIFFCTVRILSLFKR